jgi:hypothetical protein
MREEVLLSDNDRIQVMAFKVFLDSGTWVTDRSFGRKLYTDEISYQYAIGKITAKDYLSAKRPELLEYPTKLASATDELFHNQPE